MFLDFFLRLKQSKIPVSLNEFLTFLNTLKLDLVQYDINNFYYLARTSLIKDEKLIDKFDLVFGEYFKSIENIEFDDVFKDLNIQTVLFEVTSISVLPGSNSIST